MSANWTYVQLRVWTFTPTEGHQLFTYKSVPEFLRARKNSWLRRESNIRRRARKWFRSSDCKHFGILQVCLGDRVVVDVTNNMLGRTTAIHWHGVFQKGSQYMDGVPMVTQCAIHESDTFRYDFIANNEGTHFWHSHDGKYTLLRHINLVTISNV